MDVSMSSVRLETVGAVKAALVSAENLHLSLKSGLSLEEQALTHTRSPEGTHSTRYWGATGKEPLWFDLDVSITSLLVRAWLCFVE